MGLVPRCLWAPLGTSLLGGRQHTAALGGRMAISLQRGIRKEPGSKPLTFPTSQFYFMVSKKF